MKTLSLSHSRAVTTIPDPIHKEISITCFEREIVDSQFFQRLHFILQNSTTYMAFPSNKNTRFSHSLGVCHLSGEFFVNALRNATPKDLGSFLNNASRIVHELAVKARPNSGGDLRTAWKESISGHSGFRHRPSLRIRDTGLPVESLSLNEKFPQPTDDEQVLEDRQFTAGFLVDTLWQAIRICGLVHDIGHLPMSHSLEGAADKLKKRLEILMPEQFYGINSEKEKSEKVDELFRQISGEKQYLGVIDEFSNILNIAYPEFTSKDSVIEYFKKKYPIHEKRSIFILGVLFNNGIYEFDGSKGDYRTLIYYIAFIILISSIDVDKSSKSGITNIRKINNSAFRFLKLIVAGSVDGDRMDYTLRDGHSCGSDLGRFDVQSITQHAVLFTERASGDFRVAFFHRALPAIERFFVQRYQSYKYLIYHKTSSRAEYCLQHLLAEIIELCLIDPNHRFSRYFAELGYIHFDDNGLPRIFPIFEEAEVPGERTERYKKQVPGIDDANLRSFLEWMLSVIGLRRSERNPAVKIQIDKIEPLLKIVLRREFEHVYDPLKHAGLRPMMRKQIMKASSGSGLSDDLIKKFELDMQSALILRSSHRNEALGKLQKALAPIIKDGVQFITGEQVPKIYDHNRAKIKGEEVYIAYNGVAEDGLIKVRPINTVSTALHRMPRLYEEEYKYKMFFVAPSIKNSNIINEIDNLLNEVIKEIVKDFLTSALINVENEEYHVQSRS